MRNRLIITDDSFVFIDVRPMAREFFKCVDLYMYFEHEQSESLIESEAQKITHEGYNYVRTKDIL